MVPYRWLNTNTVSFQPRLSGFQQVAQSNMAKDKRLGLVQVESFRIAFSWANKLLVLVLYGYYHVPIAILHGKEVGAI